MRRLIGSFRRRGVFGTIVHAFARLRPGWRKEAERRTAARVQALRETTRAFDGAHGVETGGLVHPAHLGLNERILAHANPYEAIMPSEFHAMMAAAGEVAEGRTFVDLGCGKGRALLLGATYPFARAVGVEASAELVERGRSNLRAYRGGPLACADVSILHGDASDMDVPAGPLVIFIFNSFDDVVMSRVVENVSRALTHEPRPITVLYANSLHARAWNRIAVPKRVVEGRASLPEETGYARWTIFHLEPPALR